MHPRPPSPCEKANPLRLLAITTIRNEAPFILEWLAYHQHIGFTDFLIYSNDCDDGSDLLLDKLAERGLITHERNHSKGKKSVQWRALTKANRHKLKQAADWIYVTDIDEFLCIHVGAGTVHDLIAARPDADGFLLPWRMFGNNGVVQFQDQLIICQFTQAAPDALLWPWRAVQFKSLYRNNDRYENLGVHRPQLASTEKSGTWFDGNGTSQTRTAKTVITSRHARYDLAQVNHYALGAMESFLVKAQRGKPNHSADPIDLTYWLERNFNEVPDRQILRHEQAVKDRIDALMQDAQTAALHQAGVAWRKERIRALLKDSVYYDLFSRLMLLPPTKALAMEQQVQILQTLSTIHAAQRDKAP